MAEKDGDGPSLELPSLGFGRKRGKKTRASADETTVVPEQTPAEVPAPAPEPAPVAPELAGQPAPTEPPEDPVTHPDAETATLPREPEPTAPYAPPAPPPEPVAPPLFADEVPDNPTRVDTPRAEPAPDKPKREFSLPPLSGMTAALVTGAVAGVLLVGLTGAGFRLCEVIQGAPSCGDPGFLLLLAIVIVVIVVGKAMLAAWSVPDPGSTSFLAVGLLCVVALLFLVNVLFNWWMIIVIPALGMLCFALSHWVTTAFVDGDE
jgi:hypothetical protein